jgi:hypothetical protein
MAGQIGCFNGDKEKVARPYRKKRKKYEMMMMGLETG